jgi:hypothetical protein
MVYGTEQRYHSLGQYAHQCASGALWGCQDTRLEDRSSQVAKPFESSPTNFSFAGSVLSKFRVTYEAMQTVENRETVSKLDGHLMSIRISTRPEIYLSVSGQFIVLLTI